MTLPRQKDRTHMSWWEWLLLVLGGLAIAAFFGWLFGRSSDEAQRTTWADRDCTEIEALRQQREKR